MQKTGDSKPNQRHRAMALNAPALLTNVQPRKRPSAILLLTGNLIESDFAYE